MGQEEDLHLLKCSHTGRIPCFTYGHTAGVTYKCPQAEVRHAPLKFPLETVTLLFLQTCWVVLTTERQENAEGARERLWWLLKSPLFQFILGFSERSFIINGNGGPLLRKRSASVTGRINGQLTSIFFHRSNNRDAGKGCGHHTWWEQSTLCYGHRPLEGKAGQDTSVPLPSFHLSAPSHLREQWLLDTNSLVHWASKQVRTLPGMVPQTQHSWLLFS